MRRRLPGCRRDSVTHRVVGLILAEELPLYMDKNQVIALAFALLMVSSMVAWGATAIF